MFHHINKDKWYFEGSEWTSDEIATLYFCLLKTLETTEDVYIRGDIVYLTEKLFKETEQIKIKWNNKK